MKNESQYNFSEYETMVRAGQGALLRRIILQLNPAQLSRFEKKKFANLSRRVGLPQMAIRLLRPIIRPADGSASFADDEEKCEYGAALIKEGLVGEGLKLLNSLDPAKNSQADLFTSFGLFTRWDYAGAEPRLRRYLKSPLADYQIMVGKTNLAAALVFLNKLDEAEALLLGLAIDAEKTQSKLILSYCYELLGQTYLERNEFACAVENFKRAGSESQNSSTSVPFMVKKWLAIAELKQKTKLDDGALDSIIQEASRTRDFETVRTCNFHLAVATRDDALAKKVFYGTPHAKLREKIKGAVLPFCDLGESYLQTSSADDSVRRFDMQSGREIDNGAKLKLDKNLHRLFRIIASDFYRPIRATEIFSLLFPDEYFDPSVSVNRVHQAVKRLRAWLTSENIPIDIAEDQNTYFARFAGDYAILWHTERRKSREDVLLEDLKTAFGAQPFSLKEAASALRQSDRTASRSVQKIVNSGSLEKIGSGPATKYRTKKTEAA